jgi:hypothetical protein
MVLRLKSQTEMQSDTIAQIAAQKQRVLDVQQSGGFREIVPWLALSNLGADHVTTRYKLAFPPFLLL